MLFERPVKIEPGTIFLLDKDINIIFKDKVEAIGDRNNKIVFKGSSKEPWGT